MRFAMHTFCSIESGMQEVCIAEAIEEAFIELKRIENIFSRYISTSQLSKINQYAAGIPVEVELEVFQLIARALEISKLTSGAFDISLAPAIDFWRSLEANDALPTEKQIQELKTKIGYQNIILDSSRQTVYFVHSGTQLDLGAYVKGYALGRMSLILKDRGVKEAQINLGGNIYLLNNQPQKIAIRNQLMPDEIVATASLMNSSISTSANYERFFTIQGRRFVHLFNPKTASPAESDILSVSVISQDAGLADALSTAIFVLGFKQAKELLKGLTGVEAVIICKAGLGKGVEVYHVTPKETLFFRPRCNGVYNINGNN